MNDNSDFDIDSLLDGDSPFKTLSDGLGFHHSLKGKSEVKTSLTEKSNQLKRDMDNRARTLNLESKKTINNTAEQSVNMGELAPFYQTQSSPEFTLEEKKEELDVSLTNTIVDQPAGLSLRFSAWLLDLVVVSSLVTLTASSIIIAANIPLSYIRENLYNTDIMMAYSCIALMLYVFYFSFFDKTKFSSLGKRLLSLRIVNSKGDDITMLQAVNRTLLTLLSSLTLGIISLLLFQDKLTDTKVIKK